MEEPIKYDFTILGKERLKIPKAISGFTDENQSWRNLGKREVLKNVALVYTLGPIRIIVGMCMFVCLFISLIFYVIFSYLSVHIILLYSFYFFCFVVTRLASMASLLMMKLRS